MGKKPSLGKLLFPFALTIFFTGIGFWWQGILDALGVDPRHNVAETAHNLARVGIWLSATFFLIRTVNLLIWDRLVVRTLSHPVPKLLKDVVSAMLLAVAVVGILTVEFGTSLAGFWTASGAVGIVFGFALRNVILDVFIGLAINIDQPYKIGDWVQVHGRRGPSRAQGVIGCIKEMKWRTTRLKTTRGDIVIVPNSILGTRTVTNFDQPNSNSRHKLTFVFEYSVPADRALRVLYAGVLGAVREGGILSEKPPKVQIDGVNERGVLYNVRYWFCGADISPEQARHEVTLSVMRHVHASGLQLAIQSHEIYPATGPRVQLDTRSQQDRTQIISKVTLFNCFTEQELTKLALDMTPCVIPAGIDLVRSGDAGDSMYVLVEGLLDVYVDLNKDGQETKVGNIPAGSFLGEMSLLTGEPRSATLRAATECLLYEVTREQVAELLMARPASAEALSEAAAAHRLHDEQARSSMSEEEKAEQRASVASKILGKMKAFFGGA